MSNHVSTCDLTIGFGLDFVLVYRYVECSGVYMCMCVLDQILQDPAKMAIVNSFPMAYNRIY